MSARIMGVHIETELGWRHRLVVCVPMSILGIIDSLVSLVTIGFIQPSFALDYGFWALKKEATR